MAPNLPESSSFHSLSSLASLSGLDLSSHVLTSKYQPLIPPADQSQISTAIPAFIPNSLFFPKQEEYTINIDDTNDHDMTTEEVKSYWDTPSDENVDYFSSSYLEKSLEKDAKRRTREETNTKNAATVKSDDDNSESYWSWTENDTKKVTQQEKTKQALIDDILKEEAIRQILMGSNIVEQEAAYHQSKKGNKQCAGDNTRADYPSHEYFYFPDCGESKNDMIERILREEELRQTVLTDNIVKNLVRECEEKEDGAAVCRSSERSCGESYWSWWELNILRFITYL